MRRIPSIHDPLALSDDNLKAIEQLTITRGEGVYVYDDRGRRYLEGLAGLWCTSLGYGNEELVEAAAAQMRQLSYQHLFGGKMRHPRCWRTTETARRGV